MSTFSPFSKLAYLGTYISVTCKYIGSSVPRIACASYPRTCSFARKTPRPTKPRQTYHSSGTYVMVHVGELKLVSHSSTTLLSRPTYLTFQCCYHITARDVFVREKPYLDRGVGKIRAIHYTHVTRYVFIVLFTRRWPRMSEHAQP